MTRRGNAILEFHQAWEQANRLNQHMVIDCDICDDFHYDGCFYHARRAHQEHRAQHHPEAVSTRRRRRGRNVAFVSAKTLDQNIANARETGAATWDGATA